MITVLSIEIDKVLKALNVTKSRGCDNFSAKFLKDATEMISLPLAYIINLSPEASSVTVDLKTARVVSSFKIGDRNCEDNNRPV